MRHEAPDAECVGLARGLGFTGRRRGTLRRQPVRGALAWLLALGGLLIPGVAFGASATALAAGGYFTCALTSTGGVRCWGDNYYGQLGDGTATDRSTPVTVTGLTSAVAAVVAGYQHACALTTLGAVRCWGANYYGQLGDGTTTTRYAPVLVSGLASGVVALASGVYHTCAVLSDGSVRCWGFNNHGQLGDGTTTHRSTPVAVGGLAAGVVQASGGLSHTCAVTAAGALQCWGYNYYGQLGDGTTDDRPSPVTVSGMSSGVESVEAGDLHTCAVTSAGAARCWGWNGDGGLGDGTTTNRSTPIAVSGLATGVTTVAAGTYHSCAVTSAGGVHCWGGNAFGLLGDGTTTYRPTPVAVTGLDGRGRGRDRRQHAHLRGDGARRGAVLGVQRRRRPRGRDDDRSTHPRCRDRPGSQGEDGGRRWVPLMRSDQRRRRALLGTERVRPTR